MVKEQIEALLEGIAEKRQNTVHTKFIPTPTAEYRTLRKLMRAAAAPTTPSSPTPMPDPVPVLNGPRVLMWKQDPSVGEIGIRKAFLPRPVSTGPSDARIRVTLQGLPPVPPNAMGDFIQTPLTTEFDAVHTFAVVRQTLTLYQRALENNGVPNPLPWEWNPQSPNSLEVFPQHSQMMNAFYSRGAKALAFGFFPKPGAPPNSSLIFTCRSLDIVAHETGHAILDGLKPQWLLSNNIPQTGALHEAFGDLTAIFLTLSQIDQVEAIIAQTKANLHDKTFLSDMAEEFGLALGRPNGLRNADNDLKLSQVGNEVHALSQVFTGAIYDVLADLYAASRRPAVRDDAIVLYETAEYLRGLLLQAILQAPATNAGFADVANKMLILAKPEHRTSIRNRFTLREIVVSPVPLTRDYTEARELERVPHVSDSMPQDRSACCGTLTLPENNGVDESIQREQQEFLASLAKDLEGRKRPTREKG